MDVRLGCRMGLGGLLDNRTYSSPSLSPASSSDGDGSAERNMRRPLSSFVDDGAVDSFRWVMMQEIGLLP